MSDRPSFFPEDKDLAERAASGDEQAIRTFYELHFENCKASMLARGGGKHAQLAVDAVDEVFGECCAPYLSKRKGKRPPRLESYRGKGPLGAVIYNWCLCRLLDKIRSADRSSSPASGEFREDLVEDASSRDPADDEQAVVEAIGDSLATALDEADDEGVVLMRLAFLYGIPQKRLAELWGLHPAGITRRIQSCHEQIRDKALGQLKRFDPDLEISWEDMMSLGANAMELLWDDVPAP